MGKPFIWLDTISQRNRWGKNGARNQAAKSNKNRQQTCRYLPHPLSKICRFLPPYHIGSCRYLPLCLTRFIAI
jgi:hypothetical protein